MQAVSTAVGVQAAAFPASKKPPLLRGRIRAERGLDHAVLVLDVWCPSCRCNHTHGWPTGLTNPNRIESRGAHCLNGENYEIAPSPDVTHEVPKPTCEFNIFRNLKIRFFHDLRPGENPGWGGKIKGRNYFHVRIYELPDGRKRLEFDTGYIGYVLREETLKEIFGEAIESKVERAQVTLLLEDFRAMKTVRAILSRDDVWEKRQPVAKKAVA